MQKRTLVKLALCILALSFSATKTRGADWPMYRYDAVRSAASPQKLPRELHLRWVRETEPIRPAWPYQPRTRFDSSYEPVVVGKTLLFGSPNDDSVTALNTETGEVKWKFHAAGPVRFAPAAWKGRIFFGSDDGFLYCLAAETGKLLWKFRGAPNERMHIGNGRLISMWPVRGAPVVSGGTVYIAAGIWPTMGVFVHALDAETGKVVWTNKDVGYIEKVRIDHNNLRDGGLSPQGYLAVHAGKLLVPNGRSMPAALDRKTGKLLWYIQGYRRGDCRISSWGKYVFVGSAAIVDINTGREVGSRYGEVEKDNPPGPHQVRRLTYYEGPYFGYKTVPGCNAYSALHAGKAYSFAGGVFYTHDLTRPKFFEVGEKAFYGIEYKPLKWAVPELWQLKTRLAGNKKIRDGVLIKAANRLYAGVGSSIVAVELPARGASAKIVWEKPLKDAPASIIAADGKLFVVTSKGRLWCFGARKSAQPPSYGRKTSPLPSLKDEWTEKARRLLGTAGGAKGYCLVLGVGNGRLVEEILAQSRFRVIAVDPDGKKIDALRRKLAAAGLYGARAEVFAAEPLSFPFPPYTATLIVSGDLEAAGLGAGEKFVQKVFRALRPYGGAACFQLPEDKRKAFAQWVAQSGLENAQVDAEGAVTSLKRVGALKGAGTWSHEAGGPGRTYYSKDCRLKPPLGILWYGDSNDFGVFSTHDYNWGHKPLVMGGRLFALANYHEKTIQVIDVYTGMRLWRKKLPTPLRYAAVDGVFYVASGATCFLFEAATGKELRRFDYTSALAPEKNAFVKDLRVWGDYIVIALAFDKKMKHWDSRMLVTLDRKTGKVLWTKKAKNRFDKHGLAAGGELVFVVDSVTPNMAADMKRKGAQLPALESIITAVRAATGETVWELRRGFDEKTFTGSWKKKSLQEKKNYWLSRYDWLAYNEDLDILLAGRLWDTRAYKGKTGKLVWKKRLDAFSCIVREKTFINQGGGIYDIATGERLNKRKLFSMWGVGCNKATACANLVVVRSNFASYVDIASATLFTLRNIRSGCTNSLMAADGLITSPNLSQGCICNYAVQTSFALVPMPEIATWPGTARDVKGRRAAATQNERRKRLAPIEKVILREAQLTWDFKRSPRDKLLCLERGVRNDAYNGVIKGAEWVEDPERGRVLSFKAGNSVILGSPNALNIRRRDFAVACWIKMRPAKPKPTGMIYTKGFFGNPSFNVYSSVSPGFRLQVRGQRESSHRIIHSPFELDDGGWHHVIACLNHAEREIRLYIDGRLIGKQKFDKGDDRFDNSAPVILGGGSVPYRGEMSDLMIFRKWFNEDEALALYNVTKSRR